MGNGRVEWVPDNGRVVYTGDNEATSMTSNLFKLLAAVVVVIVLGFFSYPLGGMLLDVLHLRDTLAVERQGKEDAERRARLEQQEAHRKLVNANKPTRPRGVAIEDGTGNNDWQKGFENDGDDAVAETDNTAEDESDYDNFDSATERDFSAYTLTDCDPTLVGVTEDSDAPEVAGQGKVPTPMDARTAGVNRTAWKKLTHTIERERDSKKPVNYINEEFKGDSWKNVEGIYQTVKGRILTKLGDKPTADKVMEFLEDPANRRDLALITLIRRTGIGGLQEVAAQRGGTPLLTTLSSDLNWLTNTLYSGNTTGMGKGMKYLAQIFARYTEDLHDETARRVATTTATEFAREGWSAKDMMARFSYYYGSYRDGRLNTIFDNLAYWETRLVTGNRECNTWGSPQSLTWQRDNVRLPVEQYLGASSQLVYRLRNAAGDSVFSEDYLKPIMSHTKNITALAYREIGGVCGACSHYGAYGALASGIPAMTMGEPGHCAYTVRVGTEWKKGYSIYWQHSMHKTFWGLHDWEFLILAQDLYSDAVPTLISDQLTAMAEFLASQRMTTSAIQCYDAALMIQPLNWPTWLAYAGYLKQKAPDDKARWVELCSHMVDTMADRFHDVVATFQARYLYPQLLPLMPDKRERNKLFATFFKKCTDFGIHRWDIEPLLDAQIAGCKTDAEKLDYLKTCLSILMDKPDYSGAVLTWGLNRAAKMSKENGDQSTAFQESFSKLITRAMARMQSGKKDKDNTWAGLGEAIHTAAENGDTFTFQAIGNLAMQKCKKYFPKNHFKFRGFSGRIVSAKGSITTASTLGEEQKRQSCLHWAVLQKNGGRIPIKFEGKNGIVVKLEKNSDLNGVVALFDKQIKNDRPFHIEASVDGQNWTPTAAKVDVDGSIMRVDLKDAQASGRYVRLLREGDKWDQGNIVGFYVYGKIKKES